MANLILVKGVFIREQDQGCQFAPITCLRAACTYPILTSQPNPAHDILREVPTRWDRSVLSSDSPYSTNRTRPDLSDQLTSPPPDVGRPPTSRGPLPSQNGSSMRLRRPGIALTASRLMFSAPYRISDSSRRRWV